MTKEPHPTAKVDSVHLYHLNTMQYKGNRFVLGENYIDMISDWQPFNTQDNDVHEVFKFMEETVLTNAFVAERTSGEFIGYNSTVENRNGVLKIIPNDALINRVHCNLKSKRKVIVLFDDKKRLKEPKLLSLTG